MGLTNSQGSEWSPETGSNIYEPLMNDPSGGKGMMVQINGAETIGCHPACLTCCLWVLFIPPSTAEGPGRGALPSVRTTHCVSLKPEEASMWNYGQGSGQRDREGSQTEPGEQPRCRAGSLGKTQGECRWVTGRVRGSKTPRDVASPPSPFSFNLRTTTRCEGQELSPLSWERGTRAHRHGLRPSSCPPPTAAVCIQRGV